MRGSLVQRYKGSWSIVVGAWPPTRISDMWIAQS